MKKDERARAEAINELYALPGRCSCKPADKHEHLCELIAGLERAAAEDMRKRCAAISSAHAGSDVVCSDAGRRVAARITRLIGELEP